MSEMNRQQMQRAYQLIKDGNKSEATRLLVEVLRTERDNPDAWWLLANASDDPAKQQQALTQVLRLKPDHAAAQKLLEKINASSGASSNPYGDPFAATSRAPAPPTPDPYGDPFGGSSSRTSSQNNDPFGDPFAGSSSRTSSQNNDPFGDPFAGSSSRTSSQNNDPFGGSRPSANDDPFASPRPTAMTTNTDPYSDPFGGTEKPKRPQTVVTQQPQKKGANGCLVFAAIVGVLTLVVCGGLLLLTAAGVTTVLNDPTVQAGIQEGIQALTEMPAALNDPTIQAGLRELEQALTEMPSGTMPAALSQALTAAPSSGNGVIGDIEEKGSISRNTPINDTLPDDGFTSHSYKFSGESGQDVVFELSSPDFDTKLTLLDAAGNSVAVNDDIDFANDNLNSRLEFTLTANGAYTIVVSDVGSDGGPYELVWR